MSEPLLYIDRSEVREGALEELKAAIDELVAFIDANEPRLLSYNVYRSDDDSWMTVMHLHADPASLDFHMNVAGPAFQKFAGLLRLRSIDGRGLFLCAKSERLRRTPPPRRAAQLGQAGTT